MTIAITPTDAASAHADLGVHARLDPHLEPYVDAAIRVILRYGIRRTTMQDIAAEAGVSRQTLYASFDNKESVLRAAVRLLADRSRAAIEDRCARTTSPSAQLDIMFEQLALGPFRLVHEAPDARDIVDGLTAACADEVRDAGARAHQVITRVLASHAHTLEQHAFDPDSLADLLQVSLHGLKKLARDEAHLHALWATLRQLLLHAMGATGTTSDTSTTSTTSTTSATSTTRTTGATDAPPRPT